MNLSSFRNAWIFILFDKLIFLRSATWSAKCDEHRKMTENFTVKNSKYIVYNLIKYLNLKNMTNKAVNLLDFYWSFELYGMKPTTTGPSECLFVLDYLRLFHILWA